jgi:hypothetical protein
MEFFAGDMKGHPLTAERSPTATAVPDVLITDPPRCRCMHPDVVGLLSELRPCITYTAATPPPGPRFNC